MATYKITAPDGQSYNVNAPDSATEAEVMDYAQRNFKMLPKKAETTIAQDIAQHCKNAIGGFIRGAGSIGFFLGGALFLSRSFVLNARGFRLLERVIHCNTYALPQKKPIGRAERFFRSKMRPYQRRT